MDSSEKAKYIIQNNTFMIIASSNGAGKPWISPVTFAYDKAFNLYWVSSKEAVHSVNINARPEVAISIFGTPDGGFDGVYIDARAHELVDADDIQAGIELFASQRSQPAHFVTKSIADVTGDAAWRMYRATPVEIFKRADGTLNGQAVTVREKVQT